MLRLVFPTITFAANLFLLYATFKHHKPLGITILTWLGAYVFVFGGYVVFHLLQFQDPLWVYALSIANFLAIHFLFKESLAQKIFVFFTFWGLTSFLAGVSTYFSQGLGDPFHREVFRSALYLIFLAGMIFAYSKYFTNFLQEILRYFDHGKPYYAALPGIFFILYVSLFGVLNPVTSFRDLLLMLLFVAMVVFLYYLLFSHFKAITANFQRDEKIRTILRQREFQEKFYQEMERTQEVQAKLIHDIRHHLLTLSSMAQDPDKTEIQKYIQGVLDREILSQNKTYCEHPVANALLNAYLNLAAAQNIRLTLDIEIPKDLPMDDYDLCTLLGNTLENSMEACLNRRDPRFIEIKIRPREHHLILRIVNSCPDSPGPQSQKLFRWGPRSGLGLQSVQDVVDHYHGSLSTQLDQDRFIFSAVLSLKPLPM